MKKILWACLSRFVQVGNLRDDVTVERFIMLVVARTHCCIIVISDHSARMTQGMTFAFSDPCILG